VSNDAWRKRAAPRFRPRAPLGYDGAVQTPPCPGCAGTSFLPVPDSTFGAYHLARCVGCGHVATRPEPDAADLAALYGQEYYGPEHRRFKGPLETATTLFRRWRGWYIARRFKPGTVIDVGCGRGLLLEELRRRGWTVLGTELSDEAAEYARDYLHIPMKIGEFHHLDLAPSSADVVIMWQTFEHMREPNAVLKRVHEVLRPGGAAIVSVPNFESWQARFTGSRWHHLDVPHHLHHYGESTLRQMLERQGFRIGRVEHFNTEQNPFGWLQSLLNMMSPSSSNALFRSLQSDPEANGGRRRLPLSSLALLPVLAPVSLGLSAVESLARRGGTVTLWATK
jgi:2-polyprenyl-3-methyl-5-hydroxy-6-metoxy-1,4-benzoquinol methylase